MLKLLYRYSGLHLFIFTMEILAILAIFFLYIALQPSTNSFWQNFFVSLTTTIIGIMFATFIGIQVFEQYKESKKKEYIIAKTANINTVIREIIGFIYYFLSKNLESKDIIIKHNLFTISPTLQQINKEFLTNDSSLTEKEILQCTLNKIDEFRLHQERATIHNLKSHIDYLKHFIYIEPDYELVALLEPFNSTYQGLVSLFSLSRRFIPPKMRHDEISSCILSIYELLVTLMEKSAETTKQILK